jgi:hypothetical protein
MKSKRTELWHQVWVAFNDETRYLRCIQIGDRLVYEIIDPAQKDTVEVIFDLYDEALEWLEEEQFVMDDGEDTNPSKPTRRLTPQEKKRLSYEKDRHTMSGPSGASRRTQSKVPKLKRRQYRRRLNRYIRNETQGLYREVSDQSLRSIRPDDVPEYSREVPLDEALEEKRKRREEKARQARESQANSPGTKQSRQVQSTDEDEGPKRPRLGGGNR